MISHQNLYWQSPVLPLHDGINPEKIMLDKMFDVVDHAEKYSINQTSLLSMWFDSASHLG